MVEGENITIRKLLCIYLQQYYQSFEEATMNIVEGMKYSDKKSNLSAKPNMSMKTLVEKMSKHMNIKI